MTLLLTLMLAVPITDTDGLAIQACHPDDRVMVEVAPMNTNRSGGMFVTTNRVLYLRDMSMIPTGTNTFKLRTICGGSTSEVREVTVVIRRPVPRPTAYSAKRFDAPPLPPGFVMPLPESESFPTYEAYRRAISEGKRRNQ